MSWKKRIPIYAAVVVLALLALDGLESEDVDTAEGVRSLLTEALTTELDEGTGLGTGSGTGDGAE